MKPLLLTLALVLTPPAAGAAGGIGTAASHTLGERGGLLGAPRGRMPVHHAACPTVMACRRALRWQRHDRHHLRHLLRVRFRRDAGFAIDLAARAFHLDEAKARSVAWCESRMNPFARNPSGSTGLFQILPSTFNRTPFAGLSEYDPFVNALAAGAIVTQDGGSWREWQSSSGCWG